MNLDNILTSDKKNLLITTVGSRAVNICENWISKRKSFDVIFVYYDEEYLPAFEGMSNVLIFRQGFKYPNSHSVFKECPALLEKYNYFFLPDDDVEISSREIELLFKFAQENVFSICQPSIQPINYSWDITLNNPYTSYRLVSIVEVMCPLFSREALKICLPSFNESQSGWGLEPAWKKLLDKDIYKFAVFDGVVALHSSPINIESGKLYKSLKEKGFNPYMELRQMCKKYNSRVEFINLHFEYKLVSHGNIYNFCKNINKKLDNSNIKFLCLLEMQHYLIKECFKFPQDNHFDFYRLNYKNDKNIETFSSFFLKNQEMLRLFFINMGNNNTGKSLLGIFNLNEWRALCKYRVSEFYISKVGGPTGSDVFTGYNLIHEINYIIKTHFYVSEYFMSLIYYIIYNFSIDGLHSDH